MRKWVVPVEGRVNRKRRCQPRAHCKVNLQQIGVFWAHSPKAQTPPNWILPASSTSLDLLPLPHKLPPSVSPTACLALPTLTYPWSGLPHRSQVCSDRGSGQGQSPDSPEERTVGMTNTVKYLCGAFRPGKRWRVHLHSYPEHLGPH